MSLEELEELEEPWGLLVSTANTSTEEEKEQVHLVGSSFMIGRDKDAELVISGNRFVSTRHCLLQRDREGGEWVTDCSTNGALLNNKRLKKNKKERLADGDVITVVFKKDMPEYNVAYKFQDLSHRTDGTIQSVGEPSQDSTLDLTYEIDTTAGMEAIDDEGKRVREGVAAKRRVEEKDDDTGCDGAPSAKKVALTTATDDKASAVDASTAEAGDGPPAQLVKTDSMEQSLICQICQEIFHDCISLQPCMHCYCAGCYSGWMKNSNKCPACRCKVKRINKNYLINNLVQSFLRANPGKLRPEEDLRELDEKNKITKDMLHPKCSSSDSSDSESDLSDTESSSVSSPSPPSRTGQRYFVCRQCPDYRGGPSNPSHPPFICSSSTNHVLCQCCLQPMPDHRAETGGTVPPQQCGLCDRPYCHMYWGCTKPSCTGCLALFKDMEFGGHILDSLINNNTHESTILKDYLLSHNKTGKDMLTECCTKLDSGPYTCGDPRVSSSTRTCFHCGLKFYKELAYKYRTDIPNNDLPASVTSRPDCYWGKNCRTQRHNLDHARRYNHICEQTRTS